jgi:hypothetical protein
VGHLLAETDSWLVSVVLALAMLGGLWAGGRVGRRRADTDKPDKFTDATLAVFGLILAFTFGMSLDKHSKRRAMVVADANAVGDFYTCASLVKDPARTRLRALVKEYAGHRLGLARTSPTEDERRAKQAEVRALHDRMQAEVGAAVDAGTPVTVPLVNTFNALTSNHAERIAAGRDRLPPPILVLLALAAVGSAYLVGTARGRTGAPAVLFTVLVSAIVWVTLDLNQPARGVITVDQEPMEQVLAGMG